MWQVCKSLSIQRKTGLKKQGQSDTRLREAGELPAGVGDQQNDTWGSGRGEEGRGEWGRAREREGEEAGRERGGQREGERWKETEKRETRKGRERVPWVVGRGFCRRPI